MQSSKVYYDSVAKNYDDHYNPDKLNDLSLPYPANYIRLQMLKESFADRKNVIDCGCGNGIPAASLHSAQTCGFDISEKMIAQIGNPRFIVADVTRPKTYAPLLKFGPFDGLVCTGVMPHIVDEGAAIENMRNLLLPGGKIFIEFRNKLFSLFTANRLTAELISDDLTEVPFNKKTREFIQSKVDMSLPPTRPYDEQLARFHNPFEIVAHFEENGFQNVKTLWYHQHPAPPALEKDNPALFRETAWKMEGRNSWKDPFTCSAFVIEATKS